MLNFKKMFSRNKIFTLHPHTHTFTLTHSPSPTPTKKQDFNAINFEQTHFAANFLKEFSIGYFGPSVIKLFCS